MRWLGAPCQGGQAEDRGARRLAGDVAHGGGDGSNVFGEAVRQPQAGGHLPQ
jgi:hypothetical protein